MTEAVEGWDELMKQFEQIENMDFVSAEVAFMTPIKDEAVLLVPVDKGNLQETIRVEVEGESVNLVAGGGSLPVDYATYVELGTSKMAAQPYMRPAIDNKQKEALQAAADNLNNQMKRIAAHG